MSRKTFRIFLSGIIFLFANNAFGQGHENMRSSADSLLDEFENSVYGNTYEPNALSKYTPRLTLLKIDINVNGQVTDIRFSDSADTSIVRTFQHRHQYHNDKSTFEKYARIKSYSDVSVLIPVSYWLLYNESKKINWGKTDALMKFEGKDFNGKAIILPLLDIGIRPN